jgi:hypothetical protein
VDREQLAVEREQVNYPAHRIGHIQFDGSATRNCVFSTVGGVFQAQTIRVTSFFAHGIEIQSGAELKLTTGTSSTVDFSGTGASFQLDSSGTSPTSAGVLGVSGGGLLWGGGSIATDNANALYQGSILLMNGATLSLDSKNEVDCNANVFVGYTDGPAAGGGAPVRGAAGMAAPWSVDTKPDVFSENNETNAGYNIFKLVNSVSMWISDSGSSTVANESKLRLNFSNVLNFDANQGGIIECTNSASTVYNYGYIYRSSQGSNDTTVGEKVAVNVINGGAHSDVEVQANQRLAFAGGGTGSSFTQTCGLTELDGTNPVLYVGRATTAGLSFQGGTLQVDGTGGVLDGDATFTGGTVKFTSTISADFTSGYGNLTFTGALTLKRIVTVDIRINPADTAAQSEQCDKLLGNGAGSSLTIGDRPPNIPPTFSITREGSVDPTIAGQKWDIFGAGLPATWGTWTDLGATVEADGGTKTWVIANEYLTYS